MLSGLFKSLQRCPRMMTSRMPSTIVSSNNFKEWMVIPRFFDASFPSK